MNMDAPTVLWHIGRNQVPPLVEKGYLPLVKALGENFFQLLSNLDTMHTGFASMYSQM
jgi:hypothetical protein